MLFPSQIIFKDKHVMHIAFCALHNNSNLLFLPCVTHNQVDWSSLAYFSTYLFCCIRIFLSPIPSVFICLRPCLFFNFYIIPVHSNLGSLLRLLLIKPILYLQTEVFAIVAKAFYPEASLVSLNTFGRIVV